MSCCGWLVVVATTLGAVAITAIVLVFAHAVPGHGDEHHGGDE